MHLEKSLLVLSAITLVVSAAHFLDQEWTVWKTKYGRKYVTKKDEDLGRKAWEETWVKVQAHNVLAAQGLKNYTLEMNQFADMTSKERSAYNCLSCTKQNQPRQAPAVQAIKAPKFKSDDLPEKVDWRDSGCVTPVKQQGICGSCWAFCTVSALETRYCLTHNKLLSFSEQQFVDCDEGNGGCCGGMPVNAMYFASHIGLMESKDYEYTQMKYECLYNPNNVVDLNMTIYYSLPDEENIARSVAMDGPVTFAFGVHDDFMLYKEGVYDGPCSGSINHGMTIVGYGEECGVDYWLIRNSWGETWGMKGYAHVSRNQNMCFIADHAVTADLQGPK
ncbi:cathepsin L-like proteinase isoform 1-T2 [Discoglossus pictus]